MFRFVNQLNEVEIPVTCTELDSVHQELPKMVYSDESVRALKGPNRPVNTEYDRAYLLASMRCVDAVLIFNAVRCAHELDALVPDAYAKGGDYTLETLEETERAALLRHGVKVHFIPFVPGHSTTLILKKAGGR